MRITIDIPPNLCEAVSETFDDDAVARWAVETLVVEGVRESILSVGEAGEFLGLGYFQTEALLKERGIPVVWSDDEFERDQADLRAIIAKTP